jgi:VCBS repeat protein
MLSTALLLAWSPTSSLPWVALPDCTPKSPTIYSRPHFLQVVGSYPIQPIAGLPNVNGHFMTFGDTDHDALNEVILWWKEFLNPGTELHYRILEEQGGNVYASEYIGPNLIPYATGDLDGDGKSEIVGQLGGQIQIYESPNASSYPTALVWSSPQMTNVVNLATVGDTDRDGKMEILHSENSFSGHGNTLHIFENTGDDTYTEVFADMIPEGNVGTKVIADFDRDGLIEIGFSSGNRVYVYESPANNIWRLTWSDSTELGASDARGGVDMDGNGRPELFVTGNGPDGWTTLVFEATCNNRFRRIARFAQYDGATGVPFATIARLDGNSGPISYLMRGYAHFWIYEAVAVGRWELVGEVPDPDAGWHSGLYAFDVNRNGRDEVFWTTESVFGQETLVLEKSSTTDTHRRSTMERRSFTVSPNPVRSVALLHTPPSLADLSARVSVYDVTGRLAQRWLRNCDADGEWIWSAQSLSAGTYFVRLEDGHGRILSSTRATILR